MRTRRPVPVEPTPGEVDRALDEEAEPVRRHVLFVCACGASVSWGSLATRELVAAEERKHAAHGGLRESRFPGFRRRSGPEGGNP